MRKTFLLLSARLLVFFPCCLFADPVHAQPTISYESKITGLTVPVDIVDAKDGSGRLFIVQQNGIIRVWNGSALLPTPFLDISGIIVYPGGDERGLLSMAFHPSYTSNGYFFVYYNTYNSGTDVTSVNVVRYQVSADANVANALSATPIISIPKPAGRTNHNGGDLNFGSDGYLYFAAGDGGGGNDPDNLAQNGTSLLGKMLRIDINTTSVTYGNYDVPPDNPYIADATVDDRIWALGLRNPFRWSFDWLTGDMWIGDVGQGAKEEVNYRPAGSTGHVNYGWRCYEGFISTPGVPDCTPVDNVFPVFEYDNPNGGSPPPSAVTGGFVYRGTEYAGFRGYYISADVYSGTVYLTKPGGTNWITTSQVGLQNLVVSFGEAENGDLYAASQATNTVYKVVAAGGIPLPVTLTYITVKHFADHNQLQWATDSEQNTARFSIEYSVDGRNYIRVGQVAASRNIDGSNYSFRHSVVNGGDAFYRLAVEEDDGKINYSRVVKVFATEKNIKVYPTIIREGIINIILTHPVDKMQVTNSTGSKVFEKSLKNISGTSAITLPPLAKGIYWILIITNNKVEEHKIIIQ